MHLEPIASGVERLQALACQVDDYLLPGRDFAALGELAQDADRDPPGRLGEYPGGLGEQADPVADLVVVDRIDAAPRAACVLDRVGAVGRVADRQALGDRL